MTIDEAMRQGGRLARKGAANIDVRSSSSPEVDLARIDPDVDFRDQLDLDSMDLLNFVIAVDQELGVEIPERDYPRLGTRNSFVDYLAERLSSRAPKA